MISELGRSPGEGKGYPLQYSGLENTMDYIVHGVTKSLTRLSDFHFHFTSLHQGPRGARLEAAFTEQAWAEVSGTAKESLVTL